MEGSEGMEERPKDERLQKFHLGRAIKVFVLSHLHFLELESEHAMGRPTHVLLPKAHPPDCGLLSAASLQRLPSNLYRTGAGLGPDNKPGVK